jgi:hypothetical protein
MAATSKDFEKNLLSLPNEIIELILQSEGLECRDILNISHIR